MIIRGYRHKYSYIIFRHSFYLRCAFIDTLDSAEGRQSAQMSSSVCAPSDSCTSRFRSVLDLNRRIQRQLQSEIEAADAELHFLDYVRLALLEQLQSQSQHQQPTTARSRRSGAAVVRALRSSPFFGDRGQSCPRAYGVLTDVQVDEANMSDFDSAFAAQIAMRGGVDSFRGGIHRAARDRAGTLRTVRKRGIWSRSHSIDDDLLEIVVRHGGQSMTFHETYNPCVWGRVAHELQELGLPCCTPRQCYLHAQSLWMTRTAYTHEEDATLRSLIARHGRHDWWFIAKEIHKKVGRVYRTPFQLAQRYHVIMKPVIYDMHIPTEQVWQRIKPYTACATRLPPSCGASTNERATGGDDVMDAQLATVIVRVNAFAQATGALPLQLRSVRTALEYGMMMQLGDQALYWKVFNILCNIPYHFSQRLSHFVARVSSRYAQLQLTQIAAQWGSSVSDVRARIREQLRNSYRRFTSLNYERLSIDTFGHTCGAYVLFMEACLLSKKRALCDLVEQHDHTIDDEGDRFFCDVRT